MSAIGLTLLWCMLQVTAVSAAAAVTYLLAARGGASARGSVALAGLLLAAVLTPLAFSPWPHWQTRDSSTSETLAASQASPVSTSARSVHAAPVETAVPSPWASALEAFAGALGTLESIDNSQPSDSRKARWSWSTVVLGVVAVASLFGLVRFVAGTYAVRRSIGRAKLIYDPKLFGLVDVLRAEMSCVTPVELRESSEIATAATAGWKRPVLLLPPDWKSWSDAECRAVIAHELAHVKRQDYFTAVVSQAALAMHFYHPLLHWLAGRVRLEQELAADALAASVAGGRTAYLRCLAELALRRSDGHIAWPAKAFLPSRRTFLRRIEMLRDPRHAVDRPAPLLRLLTAGGLCVFGLLVSGIRPEPAQAQPTRQESRTVAGDRNKTVNTAVAVPETSSAAFIPADAIWVVSVQPQKLLAEPAIQPFVAELKKGIAEAQSAIGKSLMEAGVTLETVETVTLGVMPRTENSRGGEPGAFVFRLSKPADRSILEKQAEAAKTSFGGVIYQFGATSFVMLPDDRTVLMSDSENALGAMIVSGQINRAASPWLRVEERLPDSILAVMFDGSTISGEMQREIERSGPNSPQAGMLNALKGTVLPLLQDVQVAGLAITLGQGPGLQGYAACDDESGAKRVRETLEALVTIGKNTLRQAKGQIANQPPQQQALAKMVVPIAETLLDSAKVTDAGTDVTLTAESGANAAVALGFLLPAVQQAREAARRAQSMNNLKQIGLAFHNYYAAYGAFPPATIEENGVARSWRVEILPFLDQKALYDQYRKDQPWDSEANKKVLEQMPVFFKDPSDVSGPTSTSYFVFTGADTMFDGSARKMEHITDGTSNTILAVEAKRDVPWTKPEDISFEPVKAQELLKSGVGGSHTGGFIAAFADGAVKFLSRDIDADVFKSLITPAGGEVIDPNGISAPPR